MFKSIFNKKTQLDREALLQFLSRDLDGSSRYGMVICDNDRVSINVEYQRPVFAYRIDFLYETLLALKYLHIEVTNKTEIIEYLDQHIDNNGFYLPRKIDFKYSLQKTYYLYKIHEFFDIPLVNNHLVTYLKSLDSIQNNELVQRAYAQSYMNYYYMLSYIIHYHGMSDGYKDVILDGVMKYFMTDEKLFYTGKTIGTSYTSGRMYDTIKAYEIMNLLGVNDSRVEDAYQYIKDPAVKQMIREKEHDMIDDKKLSKNQYIRQYSNRWDGEGFTSDQNNVNKALEKSHSHQVDVVNALYNYGGQELIDEVFNITD